MSSEHVEVLERLRGVLEHGKMGDKCLIAPDLVTAAIASLSAPQPPAEAQGGGEVLGHVRRAAIESLRTDDEVTGVMVHVDPPTDSVPVYLKPPSAPVGVEGCDPPVECQRDMLAQGIREAALKAGIVRADAPLDGPTLLMLCEDLAELALAQQPAAVDDAIRRDADRYRWLRSLDGSCDAAACVNINIGFDWIEQHGADLDAAIDAAREARNG